MYIYPLEICSGSTQLYQLNKTICPRHQIIAQHMYVFDERLLLNILNDIINDFTMGITWDTALGHILLHGNWSPIENYYQRVCPRDVSKNIIQQHLYTNKHKLHFMFFLFFFENYLYIFIVIIQFCQNRDRIMSFFVLKYYELNGSPGEFYVNKIKITHILMYQQHENKQCITD